MGAEALIWVLIDLLGEQNSQLIYSSSNKPSIKTIDLTFKLPDWPSFVAIYNYNCMATHGKHKTKLPFVPKRKLLLLNFMRETQWKKMVLVAEKFKNYISNLFLLVLSSLYMYILLME